MTTLILSFPVAQAQAEAPAPASAKPNILIIVVDDQGYADLGAFRHAAPDVRTPNMDRLAATGVLFTQAYTTAPVCSPSRAGWNTGLYQQRWDTLSSWAPGMPGNVQNIAQIMKSNGYATARFGKNDYGKGYHVQNTPEYPLNHGYDEFLGFAAHGHDYFLLSEDMENRTPDPKGHSAVVGPLMHNEGYKSFEEGYTTEIFSDAAIDFFKEQGDDPFFVTLSYNSVHHLIHQVPKSYLDKFGVGEIPAYDPETMGNYETWFKRYIRLGEISDEEMRKYYLANLNCLDDNIGRVLDALEELSLAENTMVIFFSDNGGPPTTGAWNLPLAGSKFTLWEGGIRVPFIVSRPGAPDAGVLSDRPVSTLDVLPTCLRASGVEIPEGLDGEVISEAFDRSEEQPVDRSLFWKWNGGYAARCGDWKLLHRGGASRTPCSGIVERTDLLQSTCLFNLREDPSESLNLISEHPEIAERLQTEYSDWQENVVGSHAQELQSPNIVLFLVDDMGLMDTSVPMLTDENGEPQAHPLNDWYRTPNMERLAERGTRFSDFYAHSVCSPTRVSILTGQNSARHHTTDYINPWENNRYLDNKAYPLEFCQHTPPGWKWEGLGSADITLSSMLKQAGYTTIHVGKAHFAPFEHKGEDPLNLGFDVNVAGAAIGAPGSYYGEEGYGINSKNPLARPVPGLDKYHGTSTFLTEALTLEAQAELDKALTNDQPFFLYMSHYAVHSPFNSDPRFADHYKDPDKNRNVQAYATMIEGMDKSLGDLMDHLDAKGIADNTLIFFLGDNGGDCPSGGYNEISSSAPLRGRKGSRWEGGVRVPFIAAWAKQDPKNRWQKKMPVVAGSIRAEVASCYDLFPTILEMLGIPVPEAHTVDGQDLSKLLSGNQDPGHRDEFLSHYPHPRKDQNNYFSIYRSGKWKLHYEYLEEGVRYSLYDLKSDPDESLNLAPENPEKLRAMMKAMFRELESMGAQYPVDGHDRELKPVIP